MHPPAMRRPCAGNAALTHPLAACCCHFSACCSHKERVHRAWPPRRRRAAHTCGPTHIGPAAPLLQVDEPALREGLPLKTCRHAKYLRWAVDAFRLATAAAPAEVQVRSSLHAAPR